MLRRLLSALLGAAVFAIAGSVQAEVGTVRPVEDVRSLTIIQNSLAMGQASSLGVQTMLIREIGQRFRDAPADVWSQPGNATAAIKYLLSGGNPEFAKNPAFRKAVPEDQHALLDATISYAEGRLVDARERFAAIKARELDPTVAGHVALVKGVLAASRDPIKARQYLEEARLLGSGTLVEEAALRRQVGMVTLEGHSKGFRILAETYIRHFQASVYAGAFRRDFSHVVARLGEDDGAEHATWLKRTMALLDDAQRPAYCTAIARQALMHGRPEFVSVVAEIARQTHSIPDEAAKQLGLYDAAISMLGGDLARSRRELTSTGAVEPLDPFDASIRKAALAMVDSIGAWPTETASAAPPKTSAGGADKVRAFPGKGTLAQGREALDVATALLKQ